MNYLTLVPEIHDWRRYSSPAARLYSVIGVPDGVRVNGRLARLEATFGGICLISWQTGRKGPNGYEPMVEVPLGKVESC